MFSVPKFLFTFWRRHLLWGARNLFPLDDVKGPCHLIGSTLILSSSHHTGSHIHPPMVSYSHSHAPLISNSPLNLSFNFILLSFYFFIYLIYYLYSFSLYKLAKLMLLDFNLAYFFSSYFSLKDTFCFWFIPSNISSSYPPLFVFCLGTFN